jgi:hypothetical protein
MHERKKRNSSKVNLTISLVFHGILVLGIFFFAAHEGMLGKKLKQLTVTMVSKEKKPEAPKEKPPEPKVEQPKTAEPPKTVAPVPKLETVAAPPPAAVDNAPVAAPAAVSLPSFDFSDGAKAVQTISDPNGIYKALVEHTLRSRWSRPEDRDDANYVAEVEVSLDKTGKMGEYRWLKGSGDQRWDNSVKAALAQTKVINKPPPKGFPENFKVRFDVESQRTEPVLQANRE